MIDRDHVARSRSASTPSDGGEPAAGSAAALRDALGEAERERALLAALIRCSPTAMCVLTKEGRVLRINPAFAELFGYVEGEAVGRWINELIVPEDRLEAARNFDQTIGHGEIVTVVAERQHKDGRLVPVRVSASGVGEGEHAGAVFVMYDDITDLTRAQEELRAADERYRSIVNASTDLIWEIDDQGRWSFVNPAAREIYGMEPDELVGRTIWDRATAEREQEEEERFRAVLAGDELHDYETEHEGVGGRLRTLAFSASPLRDGNGRIVGAQGTARDVTARADARKELERARTAAEEATRAKSSFLANMSHEIRTPLNGILGMVELLMDSELDEDQARMAERIWSSGYALLDIINDVLDFSKIEAGQLELDEVAFDLHHLLPSVTRLMAVRAYEKGVELICDVESDVPRRVVGDPTKLRQVITNLVSNAVKFTHEGEVTVAARRVDDGDGGQGVRFSVKDTGIGIPEERQRAVFEEFRQVDASTTRRYGGTGLGLSICTRLIELMDGRLEVESEEGVGSEFTFTLTLPEVTDPVDDQERVDLEPLRGLRVLVVDDSATNCHVISELLGSQGVQAETLTDPTRAVEWLLEHQGPQGVDLVILDAHMPELDGFQLAGAIREAKGLDNVPELMMLTSGGDRGDAQRCKEVGIHAYLTKPIDRTELLEVLVGIFARSDDGGEQRRLITRHSIAESRRRLRILLAEDNPVNQQVASNMLRRRGHDVELVDNGRLAVEAARKGPFHAVLMDVQMPEMDGLEATRRIREFAGADELPIIALTAHALSTERDACLAAGMNEVLTKPFKPHALFRTVEGWVPEEEAAEGVAGAAVDEVDVEGLLADLREGGIEDMVPVILETFENDAPKKLADIRSALEADDLEALRKAAHAYKSSAGTIHAGRLQELLDRLETAAGAGEREGLEALIETVEASHEAALTFLGERTT